jgi:RNA polymerase sigma-70 factor (ECF subfamily)
MRYVNPSRRRATFPDDPCRDFSCFVPILGSARTVRRSGVTHRPTSDIGLDMSVFADSQAAERRFDEIFHHLGAVVSYARRRGASDPEGIAADVMAVAWRRLPDVPNGDPRPWLFSTARNLVFADWRRGERERTALIRSGADHIEEPLASPLDLDSDLEGALRSLSLDDREALLLIAWEELTPTEAARSLGVSPVAFRVRLHRARHRLRAALSEAKSTQSTTTIHARSTNV